MRVLFLSFKPCHHACQSNPTTTTNNGRSGGTELMTPSVFQAIFSSYQLHARKQKQPVLLNSWIVLAVFPLLSLFWSILPVREQ